MQYTLLEMVQMILSAMDSDEVNSISDTVESNQVALLLKGAYYDCATDLELTEHSALFTLNAVEDKPVMMTVPTNVNRINWIKYDCRVLDDTYPDWRTMDFIKYDDFLNDRQGLREHTSDIGSMDIEQGTDSFEILHATDGAPTCYTSIDDYTLIFDSYDSEIDTTGLLKVKTQAHGILYPEFLLEDDFIPDFDPTDFSYYLNFAKTRAFAELKQAANQEAASTARRQKIMTQKNNRAVPDEPALLKLPRYGRTNFRSFNKIPRNLRSGE